MLPYEKWAVLSDPHIYYQDPKTHEAIFAYMGDVAGSSHPWAGWLCLGDFLDLNVLSRWVVDRRDIHEDVLDYYEEGYAFLKRVRSIIGPKAQMVLLEGNHDYRVEDYIQRNPKDKRIYDYARNLHLDELGVKWVRSWRDGKVFKKGNAEFTHGLYTSKYHAQKMVGEWGAPIYYGHTHDVQEIPIVFKGNDKTIVGKSLGCTCLYNQTYLKGNPTKWQQAFAEFHFRPDGFFTEHTYRIFKHTFSVPNGKVYDGNLLYRK